MSKEVRDIFPESTAEFRVVHYQSCRGLEGWTVVCAGLDTYYEACYKRGLKETPKTLLSQEEHAKRKAAASCLIPLTRAISHIVIQLDSKGYLYNVCKTLAQRHPDIVNWVKP